MNDAEKRVWHGALLFFLAFPWFPAARAEHPPFVIDHSSIDSGKIPAYWIERVKNQSILLQIVGQSHSYQYENGLLLLQQQNPRYAVQIAGSIAELNAPNCLHILRSQYQ
ncbi:MAG: hypothetical protein JW828_04800, partial [Sedimentisphaerales bacterium]|nr:hypothetical protein [Sedimentisphaerales bacterium]